MDPLRKNEQQLRAYLLDITPIGAYYEDVQQIIDANDWRLLMLSDESGFIHRGSTPWVEIGSKYITASLGDYRGFPFKVNVTVYWGFNEAGELIDIWPWKTANGL